MHHPDQFPSHLELYQRAKIPVTGYLVGIRATITWHAVLLQEAVVRRRDFNFCPDWYCLNVPAWPRTLDATRLVGARHDNQAIERTRFCSWEVQTNHDQADLRSQKKYAEKGNERPEQKTGQKPCKNRATGLQKQKNYGHDGYNARPYRSWENRVILRARDLCCSIFTADDKGCKKAQQHQGQPGVTIIAQVVSKPQFDLIHRSKDIFIHTRRIINSPKIATPIHGHANKQGIWL